MSDVLTTPNALPSDVSAKMRSSAMIVHGLYAAGLFTGGLTAIVGLVLAYMRRGEAKGTIWEGHFTYAIRTFWIGLATGVVGVILTFVAVGVLILGLLGIWYIVRVVRSFILWSDNKPFANPKSFF